MTETFRFVGVGLFTVGGASLAAAALALRDTQRTIKLTEVRMGHFRAEQIRLLESLREERRGLKEELEQAREQRLEAEREVERLAERLSRESLLSRQEQGRLAEALEQERAKRLEAEQRERSTHREAERRIHRSERELQELRESQREAQREAQRETRRESSPLVAKVLSSGEAPGASGLVGEESPSVPGARETARMSRPASFPETTAPVSAVPERMEGPREGKKRPRRAVWMPHPDDGAEGGGAPGGPGQARGDAPTEMFRKHYDKYLENYKGYLELAEGLYRVRDDGEVPSGSLPKGEWEERVRRVNDGIQRTTARLDILEGHYPELVTDARISRRAGLAKRHSEFKRGMRDHETS